MSDTADKKPTQAPHEVIDEAIAKATGDWVRCDLQSAIIILALNAAGYLIVPKAALAAALERTKAAA